MEPAQAHPIRERPGTEESEDCTVCCVMCIVCVSVYSMQICISELQKLDLEEPELERMYFSCVCGPPFPVKQRGDSTPARAQTRGELDFEHAQNRPVLLDWCTPSRDNTSCAPYQRVDRRPNSEWTDALTVSVYCMLSVS